MCLERPEALAGSRSGRWTGVHRAIFGATRSNARLLKIATSHARDPHAADGVLSERLATRHPCLPLP
jgi:hypothetical protein